MFFLKIFNILFLLLLYKKIYKISKFLFSWLLLSTIFCKPFTYKLIAFCFNSNNFNINNFLYIIKTILINIFNILVIIFTKINLIYFFYKHIFFFLYFNTLIIVVIFSISISIFFKKSIEKSIFLCVIFIFLTYCSCPYINSKLVYYSSKTILSFITLYKIDILYLIIYMFFLHFFCILELFLILYLGFSYLFMLISLNLMLFFSKQFKLLFIIKKLLKTKCFFIFFSHNLLYIILIFLIFCIIYEVQKLYFYFNK